MGTVLGGSVTQRLKQLTSYSKRKRRRSVTYLLAQSIDGAVEMEEEGGGFNGSNDSQFWEFKAEQGGEGERGKGGGDGVF